MAAILAVGWLPKLGKYVPSSSIAGFLFILGTVVIFPVNAGVALQGPTATIAAITAVADPFAGLLAGAILKFCLPLLGLGV